MGKSVFFDSWQDLIQIAITVPILYLFIVLAIRIVGKRATSRMNNFDWVVTVAMGSIMAAGILRKETAILEALLAIALLLLLQWILTRSVLHNRRVQRLIKAAPTLLVAEGRFIEDAMRRERITKGEVMAALRGKGVHNLNEIRWVILEPDATFSVVTKKDKIVSRAVYEGVEGLEE